MDLQLTPERQAQLNDYALRHGQDTATALDEVLREAFEWEQQDFREAVEGIREGYEDAKAGRLYSVKEVFDELREKHGLPR
jgi:hypothetical protein